MTGSTGERDAGALAGIRVLDLSRVLAGPHATQLMGDLGAEVIRITRPREGDVFRVTPPFLKDREGRETLESSLYLSCNRNKSSVAIDISKPEGQDLVRRLAAESDVLVENYKVGDLARYGLDYASLAGRNPRLVYCSITGFGQTGPYRARPGYDSIFQAYSGMMQLTGYPDGAPNGGPLKTGPSVCDMTGGMYAAFAILAALRHRDRTGQGQYIDIGLLDTALALVGHLAMQYLVAGLQPPRSGNGNPAGAATDVYRCKDGILLISAGSDLSFGKLCAVLRCPELAERFSKFAVRAANRDAVEAELRRLIGEWTVGDLHRSLEEAGIPSAPVNDFAQAFADPQVRHREMVVETPHPLSGTVKMVANPIRFSETPVNRYRSPPLLGEHTEAVLSRLLGLNSEQIQALRAREVL